jgi:hypothetical protein
MKSTAVEQPPGIKPKELRRHYAPKLVEQASGRNMQLSTGVIAAVKWITIDQQFLAGKKNPQQTSR